MKREMKKVLVTGATGFIGRGLLKELLKSNIYITAIAMNQAEIERGVAASSNLEYVTCDLAQALSLPELIGHNDYDVFYDLAWNGAGGPNRSNYAMQLANIKMNLDCLTVAKALGCKRYITMGTIAQKTITDPEFAATDRKLFYTLSKFYLQKAIQIEANSIGIEAKMAILTGLYGPDDSTNNILNYTIDTLQNGETPSFGAGDQPFDFIHIDDCVRALYYIGQKGTDETEIFIGSGKPMLLRDFLCLVRDVVAPNAPLGFGKKPSDGVNYNWDMFNTDALKKTGFRCQFDFAEGIKHTISNRHK